MTDARITVLGLILVAVLSILVCIIPLWIRGGDTHWLEPPITARITDLGLEPIHGDDAVLDVAGTVNHNLLLIGLALDHCNCPMPPQTEP